MKWIMEYAKKRNVSKLVSENLWGSEHSVCDSKDMNGPSLSKMNVLDIRKQDVINRDVLLLFYIS